MPVFVMGFKRCFRLVKWTGEKKVWTGKANRFPDVTNAQKCRLNGTNGSKGRQCGDYDVLGVAKVTIFGLSATVQIWIS